MEANNELLNYLDRLLDATENRAMDWSKANPTTYIWATNTPKPGRVVLQRIVKRAFSTINNRSVMVNTHLLQVLDENGVAVFTVNGSNNNEAETRLNNVFESILSRETEKGFEFFKDMLSDK